MACIVFALSACASPSPKPSPSEGLLTSSPADSRDKVVASLMALIIDDTGDIDEYITMHGFLRTAETLGVPSKLYRVGEGVEAQELARQAYEDGCMSFCVSNPDFKNDGAVSFLRQKGLPVVTLYCTTEPIPSVTVDNVDYIEDCARSIGDRLREMELKSGSILIYANSADREAFSAAVREYYSEYNVKYLIRRAQNSNAAKIELNAYLGANSDVVAIYVPERDNTPIAIDAVNDLGAKNRISVLGSGLSKKNMAMFEKGLYALSIVPNYEAGANAATLLFRLMRAEEGESDIVLNRHIVYTATLPKYQALFDQCVDWFEILGEN